MELTPEERRRIYEEEKARIEAEEITRQEGLAGPASSQQEPDKSPSPKEYILTPERYESLISQQEPDRPPARKGPKLRIYLAGLAVILVLFLIPSFHLAQSARTRLVEIERLRDRPTDKVFLADAKTVVDTASQYPSLSGAHDEFRREYEARSGEYLQKCYESWQASWADADLSVERVAEAMRTSTGIDLESDFSDSQLLGMDLEGIGASLSTAVAPIGEQLQQSETELNALSGLAESYPAPDQLRSSIASSLEDLRRSNALIGNARTNLARLVTAKNNAKGRQRIAQLRRRFRERYEEGVHTMWYEHVNNPRYTNSRSWSIYPYIGKKDGTLWMCITVGYTRSDWIFIGTGGSITFVIDGSDRPLNYDEYLDVDDYIGGGVSEWVNKCDQDALIRAIATANRVVVSFSGDNGNRRIEHALTASELQAFREAVEYYDLLRSVGAS